MKQLIERRTKVHGDFASVSHVYDAFLAVAMGAHDGYNNEGLSRLSPSQRRAFLMILEKMSRILGGDPNYPDHWVDVAGYASLIANELEGRVVKRGGETGVQVRSYGDVVEFSTS